MDENMKNTKILDFIVILLLVIYLILNFFFFEEYIYHQPTNNIIMVIVAIISVIKIVYLKSIKLRNIIATIFLMTITIVIANLISKNFKEKYKTVITK